MPALSARRKADRAEMARLIVTLARDKGAEATVSEGHREIIVRLSLRSLRAWIWLNGTSRCPDCFEIPWHIWIGANKATEMSEAFERAAGASVNPYHRAKCTTTAEGFDALLDRIGRVLDCVNDGSGIIG